jgi:hypothetical protein
VTFKSFIEICKAYGLDHDSKDIKVEDHTLNFKVVRLEQHISKVTIVKEETQELPKQNSIYKEKTQLKHAKKQKSKYK